MSCHRFLTRALIAAAGIILTFAGLGSTAQAVVVQTSYRFLSAGTVDFGSGNHSFGEPEGDGVITFDYDFIPGQVHAIARVTARPSILTPRTAVLEKVVLPVIPEQNVR